uniref:Uncharacterized protein n=1 Tax=Parascaris univalens TaxID=6257 RepID=A0A914ZMN0_PARUN
MAGTHCTEGIGNQFTTVGDSAVVQMLASTNDSMTKAQHYQPVAQRASGATTTMENIEILREEFLQGTMSHMVRLAPITTNWALVGDGKQVVFTYHGAGTSKCILAIGG